MKYIVVTQKSIDQAAEDLEAAVVRNKFGVLHVHDLKAAMNKKGVDFPNECRIFEVCNPFKANAVLTSDMSLNMALPCRISIWEEKGEIKIGTLEPTRLLAALSDDDDLRSIAQEVENTIKTIIDEAK
ncbi:MAG: DUF302 domain-containing protein [Pirellulales bacterium]|nr:DUF302 domain-containing protein [Pirellulales bacterium]